ncbi:small ribosomal subunit protein mS22 [Phymastichus coffea]|uniref:small ribosomal subunit protein mS22 n=1 Tax=Phymastichus coffea TaxID=108790 RepID=UPI00273B742C|nr:small ribosomal subunit protein mS22 [Phymastichus coffea]
MLFRGFNLIVRLSSHRRVLRKAIRGFASSATGSYSDKDPAPYFFNEEVQKFLKVITRPEHDKVFRRQLDGREIEEPVYKFMTERDLKKALDTANQNMEELLQMPPVVKVREENVRILSKDPALQGYDDCKFVFTDISFGIKNKDRTIAVREPDGTLRTANHSERDRLNQIYFPLKGREIYMPKMFLQENLEPILNRGDYEFILNRACIQFDPDNPEYHRITQVTYDHIDEHQQFDKLRSTRHFGPMVFYLAWNKKVDNLLLENITTDRIEDAALILKVYYKLNPSDNPIEEEDHVKLIQHYIKTESNIKRKLDHAFKTFLEIEAATKKLEENIAIAHGQKITDTT